jgi:hypothetical protein
MVATELRIGNWVDASEDKGNIKGAVYPATVDGLLRQGSISTTGGTGHISEFNPVPLTEEWLLKFGFQKMLTSNEMYLKPVGDKFSFDNEDFLFNLKIQSQAIDTPFGFTLVGDIIEYVHQLQNRYFSFEGKELTITE